MATQWPLSFFPITETIFFELPSLVVCAIEDVLSVVGGMLFQDQCELWVLSLAWGSVLIWELRLEGIFCRSPRVILPKIQREAGHVGRISPALRTLEVLCTAPQPVFRRMGDHRVYALPSEHSSSILATSSVGPHCLCSEESCASSNMCWAQA
jgi:hypothetical protein